MTDGSEDSPTTEPNTTPTGEDRRIPWVVDVDWVAAHADDPHVTVVDVRDAWEYDGIGHVPGAVNVPFDSFRSDGEDDVGMLPGADAWSTVMRDAGITPEDRLVVYDDTHGVFAARFLVTALMYGHRDVALLDGDYAAYNPKHPTTTDATDVDASAYDAPAYDATVPDDRPLIDADTVKELLADDGGDNCNGDVNGRNNGNGDVNGRDDGNGDDRGDAADVVFVDTRDDWEFAEGHLPGAVNLDWKTLVDDETRGLLPDDEIRSILESKGVTPEKRVVLYCNTARRISHTYVVLQHLGYEHVDFFEGSLTEWHARDGTLDTLD